MIFFEDYFDKLPSDIVKATKIICDTFDQFNNGIPRDSRFYSYDDYVDAFAALEAFITANNLQAEFEIPSIGEEKYDNLDIIVRFYSSVSKKVEKIIAANTLEASRFKYKAQLGSIFAYRFSDGDITRIQELINELRDLLNKSTLFSENHKQRLLTKLENLQKELHKKMSDIDKFWGLVGDAGVVLGKFGNDAKPFFDRIKEIADIVWRTQASAEELPSGTPLPMLNKENK